MPADLNSLAAAITAIATGEPDEPGADRGQDAGLERGKEAGRDAGEKNPAAVEIGRRGGLKGGKARAASLTPEQRKETAKKAAEARWKNR